MRTFKGDRVERNFELGINVGTLISALGNENEAKKWGQIGNGRWLKNAKIESPREKKTWAGWNVKMLFPTHMSQLVIHGPSCAIFIHVT